MQINKLIPKIDNYVNMQWFSITVNLKVFVVCLTLAIALALYF